MVLKPLLGIEVSQKSILPLKHKGHFADDKITYSDLVLLIRHEWNIKIIRLNKNLYSKKRVKI